MGFGSARQGVGLALEVVGRDTPHGVELHVRVTPRAGKNAVMGERAGMLLLSVRAAPAEGEANAAVIQTLADVLGVAKSRVQIVRGEKSREKWVLVQSFTLEMGYAALDKAVPGLALRLEKTTS